MTATGLELSLWLLLAFFLGAVFGCLLRIAAFDPIPRSAGARGRGSGSLPRVEQSGTLAPRAR
jgi:hypothetical protein